MGVLNRSSAYLGAVCRGQGTNYVLDEGRHFLQGQFWGVVIKKHWESLLRYMQQRAAVR